MESGRYTTLWHMIFVAQWLLQTHYSSVTLRATQVVWTQMMVTSDMWYIDESFHVWIIPLTYLSYESIIWACTTSLFILIFIACLLYLSHVCHILSHDYVYLALYTVFHACFSDLDLLIYMYLLDLRFTVIFLILLVISCTCMPGPHHLIMYTCACYARHLAL